MKRTLLTASAITMTLVSSAEDNNFDPFKDRQFIFDSVNICAVLLVIYLLSNFILRIIKQSLEFKLKNKIIDKGTGEPVVAQLLQPETNKEKRNYLLQWFFILVAIGLGFGIISLSRPFGLHSLAIMAFSIAAGFGGYYFFTRGTGK
jgi:small neutral amino acid transporter SnatA (MarC family)